MVNQVLTLRKARRRDNAGCPHPGNARRIRIDGKDSALAHVEYNVAVAPTRRSRSTSAAAVWHGAAVAPSIKPAHSQRSSGVPRRSRRVRREAPLSVGRAGNARCASVRLVGRAGRACYAAVRLVGRAGRACCAAVRLVSRAGRAAVECSEFVVLLA